MAGGAQMTRLLILGFARVRHIGSDHLIRASPATRGD